MDSIPSRQLHTLNTGKRSDLECILAYLCPVLGDLVNLTVSKPFSLDLVSVYTVWQGNNWLTFCADKQTNRPKCYSLSSDKCNHENVKQDSHICTFSSDSYKYLLLEI